MEKLFSLAKDNRIQHLKDLVLKIGYDPKDVSVVEDIIKKKNVDIAALRKQLKLPSRGDPLTEDIEESEANKADMMKLIIEKNI